MKPTKLVVGTDFSPLAQVALDSAIALARSYNAERLHLEHVLNTSNAVTVVPYTIPDAELERIFRHGLEEANERLAKLDVPLAGVQVTRDAHMGLPARELAKVAEDQNADLIIVASHGYGAVRRAFLGSVASNLVRAAHCPVLIVGEHRPAKPPFKRVLAAIDLSPISRRVLEEAIDMLNGQGRLEVLSLYEHPLIAAGELEVLPRYLSANEVAKMGEHHRAAVQKLVDSIPHPGIEIKIEVLSKAPPPLVILEVAELLSPDLIVVGTSGHNAWHRLIIGSTATKVISDARCPVLVVPSPER